MNSVKIIIHDYISLTKPKIIMLLSVTGIVAYLIPKHPGIGIFDILTFFIMGYFASGGAMAINNYIDRDIDQIMDRTADRASLHRVGATKTLIYGIVLVVLSVTIAFIRFNLVTAMFLLFADLFYIFLYSMWLKRTSVWSTILGGVISPTPVWIGYTSELGYLPLEGLLLGLLVFIWTPSHTFAMSGKNVEDYKNAGIPMFPVVWGMRQTAAATLAGSIITVIYAYVLYYMYFSRTAVVVSSIYLIVITTYFLYTSVKFFQEPTVKNATISFRGGHTVFLAGFYILVLIQNYL